VTEPRTLSEKIWDRHTVARGGDGEPDLLYIDLHLVHEVTSPQAFDGLRLSGRAVRRPDLTVATEDHNVPTADVDKPIADAVSRTQVETLRRISSWTTQRARDARAAGKPPGPEGSLTKLNMSVTARACHTAHTMIAGSMGMLVGPGSNAEGIVSEILMSTPAMSIAGGTDEIQRNIIGERVLGLPKEPDDAKDIPYKDARRN